ncbi:unnamed protein product, partial [Closterium sp. NIES-54]
MATTSVLTFDAEGRAVDFEVWLDDLQLFLQCDRVDGLSLFDLTSGVSPAPPATADSTVHSQSAQTLYDAVVVRYSSPATTALSRLFLPYLFPDLAAFPTAADLITHLRTSDTPYRAALPAEFYAKNPPPLYLTLYYVEPLVGCSPSPLLPSVASAAAADLGGFESVGAASAPSGSRRTGRSKGGRGAHWGGGGGGGGGGGSGGGGVVVGVVVEVEVSAAAVEAAAAVAAAVVAEAEEVAEAAEAVVELVTELHRGVAPVVVSASSSSAVMRPPPPSSFVSGTLG